MSGETLKASLIESIYILTAAPLNYLQLTHHFLHLGQKYTLEETCQELGSNSLNHLIRENKSLFKFLQIFVCKEGKGADNQQYVLYYYNKDIRNNPALYNCREMLELKRLESYTKHCNISFDDTVCFDYQNSLEYIEGRKCFAQVIDYCQQNGMVGRNGYAPSSKLPTVCQELFHENVSVLYKRWFPKAGTTTNIMMKVIFEEIDCFFADAASKRENEFRIKPCYTLEDICQYLDDLKQKHQEVQQKIDRVFSTDGRREHEARRAEQYQEQRKAAKEQAAAPKHENNAFGHSDEEDEHVPEARVENSTFVAGIKLQTTGKPKGVAPPSVEREIEENDSTPEKFHDYNYLCQIYNIVEDFAMPEEALRKYATIFNQNQMENSNDDMSKLSASSNGDDTSEISASSF